MSRTGVFIGEKVINMQLDVENPLTKKFDHWETSEDGSAETRGTPREIGWGCRARLFRAMFSV